MRLRRLGAQLRRLRESAGLTLHVAAARLGCSESKISRIENGLIGVHPHDLDAFLDAYGVTDSGLREGLAILARAARCRGWWQSYRDVISDRHEDFISLESEATSERVHEMYLVPGLLQSADYTRAVVGGVPGRNDPERVERIVETRAARQQVLFREPPLQFWAVVGEAALRQVVGCPGMMREQLRQIVEIASFDHVTVQVLPFTAGAHAGLDGPFTLLQFRPAGLEVAYLENLTSGVYVEGESDIDRYVLTFDHLRASALPVGESRRFIEGVIKDL
ncbi:MAG: helix-turn-helix domain-containing protein [Carbonactinosporaceae bacterium]